MPLHTHSEPEAEVSAPIQVSNPSLQNADHSPAFSGNSTHAPSVIQRARQDPHSLRPAEILQLQRTIGNQAVARMLHKDQSTQSAMGSDGAQVQRLMAASDFQKKVKLFARKGKSGDFFNHVTEQLRDYEGNTGSLGPSPKMSYLETLLKEIQGWLSSNKSDGSSRKKYAEQLSVEISDELKALSKMLGTATKSEPVTQEPLSGPSTGSPKLAPEQMTPEIEREVRYYKRFALELRKMVKNPISEPEMQEIWQKFTKLMKTNEVRLPNFYSKTEDFTDWGKDSTKKTLYDVTEIQLAKLDAFRKDLQFLTTIVEKDQGESLQVNNVTLWSNIGIGRPAANDKELNEGFGVQNGGTALNETSMGGLLDLFAVGGLEHDTNKDFKNINGDLLLNDNQPYMQWGASFNVWAAVSADFAAKATGDVNVYLPTGTGTGSVFWTAELPVLRSNPEVKNIFIHQLSEAGKKAVADEKAKTIDNAQLKAQLKKVESWTISRIAGITVQGAGGKGISGGKLKKMGLHWKEVAHKSAASKTS